VAALPEKVNDVFERTRELMKTHQIRPTKQTLFVHKNLDFSSYTGLPDGVFLTKNPNFGKFWTALEWKMLVYFMAIWNILRPSGIFYGHLVMLWSFGIYFPRFGISGLEKSGNPAPTYISSARIYNTNMKFYPSRNYLYVVEEAE
jgi:hypothetical protein